MNGYDSMQVKDVFYALFLYLYQFGDYIHQLKQFQFLHIILTIS